MNQTSNFIPTPDQDVLDVKPMRTLAPMFPAPLGVNVFNQSTNSPLVFVTSAGQFPAGFGGNHSAARSFATFGGQDAGGSNTSAFGAQGDVGGQTATFGDRDAGGGKTAAFGYGVVGGCQIAVNGTSYIGANTHRPIDATPTSMCKSTATNIISLDDEDEDDEPYAGNQTSASGRKIKRSSRLSGYKVSRGMGSDISNGMTVERHKSYKKAAAGNELAALPCPSNDPREIVEAVLMTFEALRRRHLQLDEMQETSKRADLKAGAIMMVSNIRANIGKRIGVVPGVEIGDIFYFRMELCIIGLHAPSMGGIDYMTARFGDEDDSIAICIVAAGVYDNDDDSTDTLVYSGSGGNSNNSEERHDQKLERGNLALERSLSRKNVIRVVRGYKDPGCLTGKVYIYDGLYRIHESWKEKTKSGIICFKYKLLREPGQRDGVGVWKMSKGWIEDPSSRGRVLHPDLSSGAENLPVCLVNDVDSEKGPALFTYITQVKYLKPFSSMKPLNGCGCLNVCLPGDNNCGCAQHNGGDLPYSSSGLLVCRKPMVYECGESCQCPFNCRNRVTQKGVRVHFEVFRTSNRGWGLRSWDPIRAGSFISEYVGEIIDDSKVNLDGNEDDYIFQTVCPGEKTLKWNYGPELIGEQSTNISADTFEPLPIKISAKRTGNVSRFMNHSCAPNVFWQPVQFDHGDDGHPHIMFFALKHIPPMTELTYDYGEIGAVSSGVCSPRAKNCLCGSSNCRRYF